jgi:hypothetical protein
VALAVQVGCNFSDHTNLVSVDAEKGAYKFGYDFQREVSRPAGLVGGSTINRCYAVTGFNWTHNADTLPPQMELPLYFVKLCV